MHWELVQNDTGLWLPSLGLQMQEGSFVLAAVLAGWLLLLQSVADMEQGIQMQSEPAVDLGMHSSDKFVGLLKEKSKSWLLLPDAVGGPVLDNSVQHVVAQLMLRYLLQLGSVGHLEVCS